LDTEANRLTTCKGKCRGLVIGPRYLQKSRHADTGNTPAKNLAGDPAAKPVLADWWESKAWLASLDKRASQIQEEEGLADKVSIRNQT
jgi:hypothetical protein